MQIVGFEQTSTEFIEVFVLYEYNFFIGKKNLVETISVTINYSSDVLCFDLYLINILSESKEMQRC